MTWAKQFSSWSIHNFAVFWKKGKDSAAYSAVRKLGGRRVAAGPSASRKGSAYSTRQAEPAWFGLRASEPRSTTVRFG